MYCGGPFEGVRLVKREDSGVKIGSVKFPSRGSCEQKNDVFMG